MSRATFVAVFAAVAVGLSSFQQPTSPMSSASPTTTESSLKLRRNADHEPRRHGDTKNKNFKLRDFVPPWLV
jgi:hypothetical protein